MSIIKLEPGQKILFTVALTESVEGNFGPQVKFTSTTGDTLFLNVEPAERQLGRIGYTTASVRGQTVEFERIVKDGKKFTNINKPGAQKLATASLPTAHSAGPHIPEIDGPYQETGAPPVDAEPDELSPRMRKLLADYDVCWGHAVELARRDLGNDASHEGISAQAATMFIQACQPMRGV